MTELAEYFVEMAYENSFLVLTDSLTVTDVMSSEHPFFAHAPLSPIDEDTINSLIKHFEEREDYEKCAILKKIWNSETIK